MRKQFVVTVESLMAQDERLVLLLGDIGVFGFRHAFDDFPKRVYNIGILEQSSVSLAAGLAKEGFIPIFHSIAPFVVERAFEQLKIDFGYQELGGIFVSVGGSYDYAALGCTHHCPGDVALMKTIPSMQVVVPGSTQDFDSIFRCIYQNNRPKYFRLSEFAHTHNIETVFAKASVVKQGLRGTVIAVGPLLDAVLKACLDLDVSILYYTTLEPFDYQTLEENCPKGKLIVVQPFYTGTLAYDIQCALSKKAGCKVLEIGVPHRFLTTYGKPKDHDTLYGLTADNVRMHARTFLYDDGPDKDFV